MAKMAIPGAMSCPSSDEDAPAKPKEEDLTKVDSITSADLKGEKSAEVPAAAWQDVYEDEHPSSMDPLALAHAAHDQQAMQSLKDGIDKAIEQGALKAVEEAGGEEVEENRPPTPPLVGVRKFQVSWFVRAGGSCLGLCAGVVNAVSFHALGTFTSHHTGSISKVGMGIADRDVSDPMMSLGLILSFVGGSTSCGFIIAKSTVHFGFALYDIGLFGVCLLLSLATLLAEEDSAMYLASAACGLQNGMATEWGGAVIRTTHVTGLFTDVGLLIGRLLSMFCRKRCGRRFDHHDTAECMDGLSKLTVLLSIGLAYLVGIILGSVLHDSFEEKAFLVPAAFTGSAGFAYSMYRVFWLHEKFFSTAEMDRIELKVQVAEYEPDGSIHITNSHTGETACYVLTSSRASSKRSCSAVQEFAVSSHGSSNSSRKDSKRSDAGIREVAEDAGGEQKARHQDGRETI